MNYSAKILVDSISEVGARITSILITCPRFILPEISKHRVFSINAQSSRAIPTKKLIEMVENYPVFPSSWPKNEPGMVGHEELSPEMAEKCETEWRLAVGDALWTAKRLSEFGLHKEEVNRILEPYSWTTILITSTQWKNFFHLRTANDAQPEMMKIALLMQQAYLESSPASMPYGGWHLPFVDYDEDPSEEVYSIYKGCMSAEMRRVFISTARCARLSYLTHEGVRDYTKDLRLSERLSERKHWSCFEHQATPALDPKTRSGNFVGWHQFRKDFEGEDGE